MRKGKEDGIHQNANLRGVEPRQCERLHKDMFFLLYIFWHVQIMKNHGFCCNFSSVNVCGLKNLLHLFIRYTIYHFLY